MEGRRRLLCALACCAAHAAALARSALPHLVIPFRGNPDVVSLAAAGRTSGCPRCDAPEVLGQTSAQLSELSGMASSAVRDNIFYGVVDTPLEKQIWTLNASGSIVQTIKIEGNLSTRVGATHLGDWEAIATGPCIGNSAAAAGPHGQCIFIADTGDNCARDPSECHNYPQRRLSRLIQIPEPATSDPVQVELAEVFTFGLPGGRRDIESLAVTDDGRIYVLSKSNNGVSELYVLPFSDVARNITAENRLHVEAPGAGVPTTSTAKGSNASDSNIGSKWFTDMSLARSAGGPSTGVTLRTAGSDVLYYDIGPGEGVEDALRRPPCRLPAGPGLVQPEAIAWNGLGDSFYYLTSGETGMDSYFSGGGAPIVKVRCDLGTAAAAV